MIKAANKYYVIEGVGQKKETSSGIIIQRTDETELALILSAGPQVEDPYAEGTMIAINWGAVVQIKVNGKGVYVIHADNILAVIED